MNNDYKTENPENAPPEKGVMVLETEWTVPKDREVFYPDSQISEDFDKSTLVGALLARAQKAEAAIPSEAQISISTMREDGSVLKYEIAAAESAPGGIDACAPERLRTLADWFDVDDENKGQTGDDEVQRDLRRWADQIAALDAPARKRAKGRKE